MRVLLIILILSSFAAKSQEVITSSYIDSLTYNQYINSEFKDLQQTGKKAIKNGIDFYYLRLRLGMSYYEKKNYEESLAHFYEAIYMNPNDTIAKLYYYYALLFSARNHQAYDLAISFNDNLKTKISFNDNKTNNLANSFSAIAATFGYITNKNINAINKKNIKKDALYAESTFQDNSYFANLYLENNLSNRLAISNNFGVYQINTIDIIQSDFFSQISKNFSSNNFQYNLTGTYHTRKNWIINPSFSYYFENSNYISTEYIITDDNYLFTDTEYKHNAIVAGLNIYKRLNNIMIGLNSHIGNLTKYKQRQIGTEIIWYPFGNYFLYTKTSYSHLINNKNAQKIIAQSLGYKITHNLWQNISFSYGNHQNHIKPGGFSVYNTIEPVSMIANTNIIYYLNSNLSLIPSFEVQQREWSAIRFYSSNDYKTEKKLYLNYIINFTIKWRF